MPPVIDPVASSPEPRRVATPRWLDLRLVVGVVLVLASVVLGAVVVSRADDTSAALGVTHDVAAGTVLRESDLEVVQVRLPEDGERVYLADLDDAVGKTLRRSLDEGELLPAKAVGPSGVRTRLTVVLAAGAAPDLRPGQRIQLWLSTPSCAFVVLLPDVTVQSARTGGDGSLTDPGDGQSVVISIDPALVPRVVAAQSIEDAQLRAGVVEGASDPAASSAVPTQPSAGRDASGTAPSGLPADLATCAGPSAGR